MPKSMSAAVAANLSTPKGFAKAVQEVTLKYENMTWIATAECLCWLGYDCVHQALLLSTSKIEQMLSEISFECDSSELDVLRFSNSETGASGITMRQLIAGLQVDNEVGQRYPTLRPTWVGLQALDLTKYRWARCIALAKCCLQFLGWPYSESQNGHSLNNKCG